METPWRYIVDKEFYGYYDLWEELGMDYRYCYDALMRQVVLPFLDIKEDYEDLAKCSALGIADEFAKDIALRWMSMELESMYLRWLSTE